MTEVIDLTNSRARDPERILENAVTQNVNPKGTRIIYHIGDFGDEIAAHSKLAAKARELSDRKLVVLCQKLINREPVKRMYMAVIR